MVKSMAASLMETVPPLVSTIKFPVGDRVKLSAVVVIFCGPVKSRSPSSVKSPVTEAPPVVTVKAPSTLAVEVVRRVPLRQVCRPEPYSRFPHSPSPESRQC